MIMKFIEDIDIEELKIDNNKLSRYLNGLRSTVINNDEFYADQIGFIDEHAITDDFLEHFMQLKNKQTLNSVTIITGGVGKGKSSFFGWWIKKNMLAEHSSIINVNSFNKQKKISIADSIYSKCVEDLNSLLGDPEIKSEFDSRILKLAQKYNIVDKDRFKEEFTCQTNDFKKKYTLLGLSLLLYYLICSVYKVYRKPIWIIIDNVDLEKKEIQNKFIHDIFSIYEELKNKDKTDPRECAVHFFLTIRPETSMPYRGAWSKYHEKYYPDSNVLTIANRKIEDAMQKITNRMTIQEAQGMFPIQLNDSLISNIYELNDIILKNLKLEDNHICKNWYAHLVNYNVRRFINSWVNLINSKNFIDYISKPSLHSNVELKSKLDPYLRFLIKGKYNYFPGNHCIDGESPDSPLFFNLFGLKYKRKTTEAIYIKNYLIFIRILQYLEINKIDKIQVTFDMLEKDLSDFYDSDYIIDAVKILLWARIIDETNLGIRNIFNNDTYLNINLDEDKEKIVLQFTETSSLYINYLIYEYEYLSAMANVSYQIQIENSDDPENESILEKYANWVFKFLISWQKIMYTNLSEYKNNRKLIKFQGLFNCPNDKIFITWQKIVISTKEKLDNINKVPSIKMNIEKIASQLDKILKEGTDEINSITS